MSEIVTSKLADIADVIDSLHKTPKYSDSGYPMVRCVDLSYGSLKLENTQSVSEEVFNEYSRRYKPNAGDIIITRVGANFGVTSYVEESEFCLGQNTAAIVPTKISPRYLYYILNSVVGRQQINMSVAGAAQPTLSLKAINNLDIPRLGGDAEDKIANMVGDLDDKIELNRQTNQALEQIAQAIFKSWFVDFEPVKAKIKAKQNGQDPELAAMFAISGKTEEQLKKLDDVALQQLKTTAAFFPDAVVDSELGEIPEEWEVKPLSKMIELIGGGTPKKSEESYWGGEIPWFSVKDAPAAGDVFVIDTDAKITDIGLEKSSTKLLPEGTTIISARGTVGRLALVGVATAMNQSCYGVKGINKIGPYLNYLNIKEAVSSLQQNTHGAVFDTITRDTFDTVKLIDAPSDLKIKFEMNAQPLFLKIKNNLFEIESLTKMREELLPRLLSGELVCGKPRILL